MRKQEVENMYGGNGTITFEHLLESEQMNNMARVYAKATIPPHGSIGYHVHNGDGECGYVLSGKGIMDDNHEREIRLEPGMSFFTPDGRGHGITNDSDEPFEIIALIPYTKK